MRWTFFCSRGSPSFVFDGETPYQRGVGGAELGIITLCEALAERGHSVTVFNQPPQGSREVNGVWYRDTSEFDQNEPQDIFVLFRNPYHNIANIKARRKIFWSCDQYTEGNYAADVFPYVDAVVTISPYHAEYFVSRYGVNRERIMPIDLPVRVKEYELQPPKNHFALLYCSVPDRGLHHLLRLFPRIRAHVPDAQLWVTSDYSLWGEGIGAQNEHFSARAKQVEGVQFFGKVPRAKLVELQQTASVMAYPNTAVAGLYELFSISAAECQVVGTIPVTSARGGLATTVMGGVLIDGEPGQGNYDDAFVAGVTQLLAKEEADLAVMREGLRQAARARFDPMRIVEEWRKVV